MYQFDPTRTRTTKHTGVPAVKPQTVAAKVARRLVERSDFGRPMSNLPAKLLKRVLGWIKGENRDYSKSWLQERKEHKAAQRAAAANPPPGTKQSEAGQVSRDMAAHHDSVWLALGSLTMIGGIGLLTAGWLGFVALVLAPSTAHPSVLFTIAGIIILVGGLIFLSFGVYIVLAIFRGWLLPSTAREKADAAKKRVEMLERAKSEGTTQAVVKP